MFGVTCYSNNNFYASVKIIEIFTSCANAVRSAKHHATLLYGGVNVVDIVEKRHVETGDVIIEFTEGDGDNRIVFGVIRLPELSDAVSDVVSDPVSDEVSDVVSDRVSDAVSDEVSDAVSDGVSDLVSDAVSDGVSDLVSDEDIKTGSDIESEYETEYKSDFYEYETEYESELGLDVACLYDVYNDVYV